MLRYKLLEPADTMDLQCVCVLLLVGDRNRSFMILYTKLETGCVGG